MEHGEESARPSTHEGSYRKQVQQLKRLLGGEGDGGGFFKGCLAKSRGSTPEERRFWRDGIYDQIREMMPLQGSLNIERMCEMARVSRASFYRSLREHQPVEEAMEVRSTIQQIAIEHRHFGAQSKMSRTGQYRVILWMDKSIPPVILEPKFPTFVMVSIPALRDVLFEGMDRFLIDLYKNPGSKEARLADMRFQKFVHKMPTDQVMSAQTSS